MKKISYIIFGLFISLKFLSADEVKTEFEMKRYDFQQQDPKVILEHYLMDNMEAAGDIIGSYLKASFLRDDDLVYIRLKDQVVSVGDHFMVYEDKGPVDVPGKFGKSVGRDIGIKAYAEVIKVTENSVVAKLYNSTIDVHVGDKVALPVEQNVTLDPKEPAKMIRGQVLRSVNNLGLIGPFDFVYINRGSADGLQINDRLYAYRTTEGVRSIEAGRPPVNMAELVVVHLGEHVGTAYILSADDSFLPGTLFKSAISDVKFLSDTAVQDLTQATSGETQTAVNEDVVSDEESFEATPGQAYFQFGPGIFMRISKDGLHKAYFSFLAEYGSGNFAFPVAYGIYSANSQDISFAPRYQMEFFPFESMKHLSLLVGAGPLMIYGFNKLSTQKTNQFSLGIEGITSFKYYIAENMFTAFTPFAMDAIMYRYLSTSTVSTSSTDLAARWNMYLTLGFTF